MERAHVSVLARAYPRLSALLRPLVPTRITHVLTVPLTLVFFRGQVRFMQEHDFSIEIVSAPGPLLDAFGAQEKVSTWPLPMRRQITPWQDTHTVRALWNRLRQTSPHIVHGHTPKGGLVAMIAAWLAKVPVRIYHVRGLPFETAQGWQRTLLRTTERISCLLATHVLCNSTSNREVLIRARICPPDKVQVLGHGSSNGVDATGRFDPDSYSATDTQALRAQLGIPASARVCGFIGRLVRDKGILELAEAWTHLRTDFPDLHLLLVGPFEERDAIPDAVRASLENDPRVHLTGMVDDPARYYALLDVLAFPSHREGFPNVLLEAAAMRVPVVAARSSGNIDAVVEDRTGLLVAAGDAATLADAIRCYLNTPALGSAHGEAARQRVLNMFQPVHVWNALLAAYRAALSQVPPLNPTSQADETTV